MTVQKRPDDNIFASSAKSGELETFPDILRGWGISFELVEGKPPMEWFNYLFKRQDEAIKYMLQQGLPEWSATEDYPIHAFTKVGNKVYRALSANKNKAPATNAIIWKEWGLDADLVLLKANYLSEIKAAGATAQKAARDNIGAIAASDVDLTGYVPTARKINTKSLTTDVILTASDVGAAPTSHGHTIAQISGLDTALTGKAPASHSHTIANVTGLQTALDGKSPTSHGHSNLANTNASNIDVPSFLNKLGLKEASLNSNGWQKLPSGLIIQWGFLNTGVQQRGSVNFPIPFPNSCFVAIPVDYGINETDILNARLNIPTKLSFDWVAQNFKGEISTIGLQSWAWLAVGY